MITIERRDKANFEDRYGIIIDGIPMPGEAPRDYQIHNNGSLTKDFFNVQIFSKSLACEIAVHRFPDIAEDIHTLELRTRYQLIKAPAIFHNSVIEREEDTGHFYLNIHFKYDAYDWEKPWSVSNYNRAFFYTLERERPLDMDWRFEANAYGLEPDETFISLRIPITSFDLTIEGEIWKYSKTLQHLHELTERALLANIRHESVVVEFNFPEEVRVPCEQYLLYFARFLKDLGVEATTDIQHEAGQVLFSVTPANKDEALDKIHTALKNYLQLASSPLGGSPDPENEMAIQSLLANVDHLKSQLRLSYMMVRAQETTIQAQQVTIANQQRILSGEVLLDSLKTDAQQPKVEEKEEVIDGILALGKYEEKGVTVNLGEVYRRLKQLFKNDSGKK